MNPLLKLLVLFNFSLGGFSLEEEIRLEKFYDRNYTFPYQSHHYIPNTPGWRSLMERRMSQSFRIKDDNDRYSSWMIVSGSAVVVPNYTKYGWGLTRAPDHIIEALKESLQDGLKQKEDEIDLEGDIDVMKGSPQAFFIAQEDLNEKIMKELKPMHEDWSNTTLVGSTVYGLRVYRNNSQLRMHTDKSETHIISCILHVDHSADSEPWPIVIEDFTGATNEVYLESGDMLFYESSKCLHGRTRPFNGSWYSSVFVHYRPEEWDLRNQHLENHYAVPSEWEELLPSTYGLEKLEIVGTGLKEPECDGGWCALEQATRWFGPAKDGMVIDPDYYFH